ncbi:MAG: 2-hydroxyacyl-CoA dehydratase [Deltaproteobacteria bacterium]|nr:2-hydroxyacyl-CoA dehydratase [Deltaproteobacteria bacterium]
MHRNLKIMAEAVQNAPSVLQNIKNRNKKKIIGYFFPVFPQEILYAAGLHPVQLYPGLQEPITLADDHLQTYLCAYLRAQWDQILKGKHAYLDGAIIPRSCEAVTFLYQTWKRHNPFDFIDYLNIPWKINANTHWFFTKELQRIKKNLETYIHKEITSDALANAIVLHNQNRLLLKKACGLRNASNPIFSARDVFNMVMSGFVLDKKEHTQMMTELLSHVEETTAPTIPEPPPVRLLLSGGCVLDTRLLDIISSAGAIVVADDFNNGTRSFQPIVAEGEDPMESLAKAYATVPCGFNTAIEDRLLFMADAISKHAVDGVLFAVNRNCETEKFDYPILDRKIREQFKIPTMLIETDYLCAMGPLQTRIEAFIEMIGGKDI